MNVAPLEPGSSRPGSGTVLPPQKVRSRTHSLSSDRPSTISHALMSPPLSVSPEAAFIATSAASQIVTNDHDSHADAWYDEHGMEPPSETAMVSTGALNLVNSFLDQLLFNFLSVAQSTSLSALRPAVSEVLKPKLAKDAVNQADEELREYLGGGDDDDDLSQAAPSPRDWDLELVWKRTRLRCMVCSSLGDMEEEDEDYHMEQEGLISGDERPHDNVSPAVAIFLTSILEFMGEQALVVAGQASYHRARARYEKSLKEGMQSPVEPTTRIIVEELDMERVALDRTLGRLWRAWKKRIRSPTFSNSVDHSFGRPYSRDSSRFLPGSHLRQASLGIVDTIAHPTTEEAEAETTRGTPTNEAVAKPTDAKEEPVDELVRASSIPLPEGPDDITEILIPGLAYYSDDEEDEQKHHEEPAIPLRPKSMMVIPHSSSAEGLPTPTSSEPQTPRLPPARKRANSLPTPATSPYRSPPFKRARVGIEQTGESEDLSSTHIKSNTSAEVLSRETPADDDAAALTIGHPATAEAASPGYASDTFDEAEPPVVADRRPKPNRKSSAQIAALIAGIHPPPMMADAVSMTGAVLVDEAEEIDEFTEEPQILTSSRVSMSGRSNSPAMSDHVAKPAITIGIPTRSASVHSLRVIEVTSPRSPITRSRNSSVEAQERSSLRSSTLSRTDSVATPPIVEEGGRRQISPTRKAFPVVKPTLLHKTDSISEDEEVDGLRTGGFGAVPTPATVSPISEPQSAARYADLESQLQSSHGIFGSVQHHTSPPMSPARQSPTTTTALPQTKVTILGSSNSAGTFDDERPDVPIKSPVKKRQPPPPTLPERNMSRPVGAGTPSPEHVSPIGMVSVERPVERPIERPIERPSPPRRPTTEAVREQQRQTPPRPQDPPSLRQMHHESSSSIASSQIKFKQVRSSQESSSRPEDVARNFEELIQSDQTIQYTLTPESMRDIDSTRGTIKSDSPVLRPKSRKSEDVQQVMGDRVRSSSTATSRPVELKRATSVSRSTGLHSHPFQDVPDHVNGKLTGPVPRTPAAYAGKSRGAGPQARDARVPRESLADFADFIRATGPPGGYNPGATAVPGRVGGAGLARQTSAQTAPPPAARYGVEPGRVSTASSGSINNPNRARLLARDAAVDPREDNSDLIDFIRQGPPSGAGGRDGSGNPRIPRTVAPFRTTMDSDQFAGAVGGKAVDATIPDIRHSAASTSITERSAHSSVNSSSALLRKGGASAGRNGYGGGAFGGLEEDDDPMAMMMPKRKTRRVRDPYAIDLSDEDDEFLESEPTPRAQQHRQQQQQPKEESLADFLRNVPPPPEPSAPVPFNLSASQQPRRGPKKKASAPSLMARFTRRAGGGGGDGHHSPTFPSFSSSGRSNKGVASESVVPLSRSGSIASRGHIPIQVNIPTSEAARPVTAAPTSLSRSVTANTTASGYGTAVGGSGGRVRMKKFEPRDAVPVPNRATSELADFLRSSEPPRDFGISAAPVAGFDGGATDGHKSRRMFGRRKPSGVF